MYGKRRWRYRKIHSIKEVNKHVEVKVKMSVEYVMELTKMKKGEEKR